MALWYGWDYLPGTLRVDPHGNVFGTGTRKVSYPSGKLQAEEYYIAGVPHSTIWYRPDGTTIATTRWDKNLGGTGYSVDDNGNLKMKCQSKYDPETRTFLANGEGVLYNIDGTVDRITRYINGVEAE
jgi:antitoxin component YwqK of YwqJK toxin-antitoxin module